MEMKSGTFFVRLLWFLLIAFQAACQMSAEDPKAIPSSVSPAVESLNPSSGFIAGGSTLNITGRNFKSGAQVFVGGLDCSSVVVNSATSISCTLPGNSVGSVDVIVKNTDSKQGVLVSGYEYRTDVFNLADTVSGKKSPLGAKTGNAFSARFYFPSDVAKDGNYLYISDTRNNVIRRVTIATSEVIEFAGQMGAYGSTDGTGAAARFYNPMGLAVSGGYLYVADNGNCTIRKVNLTTAAVTTVAGSAGVCNGADNAVGTSAQFYYPTGLIMGASDLYITEECAVKKMSLSGSNAVTLIAGSQYAAYCWGSNNGTGTSAKFNGPSDGVIIGNYMYLTDGIKTDYTNVCSIRRVDLSQNPVVVATEVGSTCTHQDGTGASAKFNQLSSIDTDGSNLYISDFGGSRIRKYNIATQTLTTLAGSGSMGNVDAVGTSALLWKPTGMTISGGDIYFVSYGASNLRKYNISSGAVSTVAGGQ